MPITRIWTGLDAYVEVYHTDANGNRIRLDGAPWVTADGPLLGYCYFQNTTLTGDTASSRRAVTGRPHRRLIVSVLEPELEVEHFYLSKVSEASLEQIFHREKRLELVLRLQAAEDPSRIDLHTLKFAKRTAWKLGVPENGNATGTAKFLAEQLV